MRKSLNGHFCPEMGIYTEYYATKACNPQQSTSIMANDTSMAVTIFQPNNVQQIVALGPTAFEQNTLSHDRCLHAGQELLDRIKCDGMNDAIDQEVAKFIEKAKATLNKMNGKRSPVTKLFDEIRTVFTTLEAEVDPQKAASIPGQLQQYRDKYAAKKRAEAEAKRQEEARRQAATLARTRYTNELEEDYKAQFNAYVIQHINALVALDASLTLDNFNEVSAKIKAYPVTIDASAWLASVRSGVRLPYELTPEESRLINEGVRRSLADRFAEQYQFEIEANRDDILDRLPSKQKELQRIAAAGAEEAARIKAEIEARERAEAQRKEQERMAREAADKAQAELEAKKAEMDGLFGVAQLQKAEYQPKTAVRKRIMPLTPEAFMPIVGFWWSHEGQNLSVEELGKIFKKMVTFCEKAANDKDNPIFLDDANIAYQDEVKAK